MPLREMTIAALLVVLVVLVAFACGAVGSEFYVFLPWRVHVQPPPTSPWQVLSLVAISTGDFFLSRRYAAMLVAVLAILVVLGFPIGTMLFDWTPGIGQYLLLFSLGGLAIFVWTHDDLNED